MKHYEYTFIVICIGILSASCGNESKKAANELENTTQTIKNAKNVVNEVSAKNDNIQQLRKKDYLTKEQFEVWLPKSLLDIPLSSTNINMIPGLGHCGVNYRVGNKNIKVLVFDGSGEKGAGSVGPYRMSSKMEYDTEDTWGYTKTVVIDGIKAKKSYTKSNDSYSLSMFYDDRFAVDIRIQELEENSLEQIVEELNLSQLKKL